MTDYPSRHCLLCGAHNPCRDHSGEDQRRELDRNEAEVNRMRAAEGKPPLEPVRELLARMSAKGADAPTTLDGLLMQARMIALEDAAVIAASHADQCEDTTIGRRSNGIARDIADEIRTLATVSKMSEKR